MTTPPIPRREAMPNAFDAADLAGLPERSRQLIERRYRALGPAYRLFYEQPLEAVCGEGVWLFDAAGRRYLDAYNNVASMGHAHPHVVQAVSRQLARLNTHTRYLGEDLVRYAERLLATFDDVPRHLMLTCTGSEANDLALRIAETATGARGVIVTRLAYHGLTHAVAQCSPALGDPSAIGAHVRLVDAPAQRAGEDVGARFAADVGAAIESLQAEGHGIAALLCDTIFSSDGVLPDPAGFLEPAVQRVHRAGGLFIADEVQPGFVRTGAQFWGYQRHGVVPDLVTLGKPMGNGYPVAGVAARQALLEEFGRRSRYFNTYGGTAAACAAGMAVLDVIEREGLQAQVAEVGMILLQALRDRAVAHPLLGEVRGSGLFIGVDVLDSGEAGGGVTAARIVNGLRRRGVLISASGPHGRVLKIRPPLVFGHEHAQILLSMLDEVLEDLPRHG